MDAITFAREFASRAHRDQLYGELPYATHLEQVAQLVAPLYRPMEARYRDLEETSRRREQVMVIAYLHDIVEDTPVTRDVLVALFGTYVANAVQSITDPKAHNRKERKRLLYGQLQLDQGKPWYADAVTVKVADRLANVVSSSMSESSSDWRFRMYQKEHPQFRLELHNNGMCDSLWERLDDIIRRTQDDG